MATLPGIHDHKYRRHIQQRGQKTLEKAQYDQTCSILRYRTTAVGNPAVGIAPTVATCIPALTAILCSVSELGELLAEVREGQQITAIEHDERNFAFLEIPATTTPAVAVNTLLLSDFILFGGFKWRIRRLGNDDGANTGTKISWCVASMWRRG